MKDRCRFLAFFLLQLHSALLWADSQWSWEVVEPPITGKFSSLEQAEQALWNYQGKSGRQWNRASEKRSHDFNDSFSEYEYVPKFTAMEVKLPYSEDLPGDGAGWVYQCTSFEFFNNEEGLVQCIYNLIAADAACGYSKSITPVTNWNPKRIYWDISIEEQKTWQVTVARSSFYTHTCENVEYYLTKSRLRNVACPEGYSPNYSRRACELPLRARIRGKPQSCGSLEGNPCNVVNGDKYQQENDYTDPYLPLNRSFHSYAGVLSGVLGRKWMHNYETRLILKRSHFGSIMRLGLITANGYQEAFKKQGTLWQSTKTPGRVIQWKSPYWIESGTDGSLRYYQQMESYLPGRTLEARLVKTRFANGLEQTLQYGPDHRLSTVTGPFGRQLAFQYDAQGRLTQVELPLGLLQYSYDDLGNLQQVSRPDGTVRTYHYEDKAHPSYLTGITDERGIRLSTYRYDDQGRAIVTEHAGGVGRRTLSYLDVEQGDRTESTDALGRTHIYQFDSSQGYRRLLSDTYGDQRIDYHYGGNNDKLARSKIDSNGQQTLYTYDGNRLTQQTEAAGTDVERVRNYQWTTLADGSQRIRVESSPSVYAGAQHETHYTYDDQGHLLTREERGYTPEGQPVNRSTRYEYAGPKGQLSAIDGPRTDVEDITRLEYYPDEATQGPDRARLKAVYSPTGEPTRKDIHYTPSGKIASEIRHNTLQIEYSYQPGNDRLAGIIETDLQTGTRKHTRYTRLATGQVSVISTWQDNEPPVNLYFEYDDAQRLRQVRDQAGNRITYELDLEGNRIEQRTEDAQGSLQTRITQLWDRHNRLTRREQANQADSYEYDGEGNLLYKGNARGRTDIYLYDALNRLVQATEAAGQLDASTYYTYDLNNHATSITSPNGAQTRYSHDDFGNLLQEDSPDRGITRYRYDSAGNMIQRTTANGIEHHYRYDAAGRPLSHTTAQTETGYTYDTGPQGTGWLVQAQHESGTDRYSRDAWGRVTEHETSRAYGTLTWTYRYHGNGTPAIITWPNGLELHYSQNQLGQNESLTLLWQGQQHPFVEQALYQPFGRLSHLRWAQGSQWQRQTDLAGRDTSIQSAPGFSQHNLYDPAGNLLRITHENGQQDQYQYDLLNRLTNSQGTGGTATYLYDLNGNRLQETQRGQNLSYQPQSNRLQGDWQLDAEGNTLSQPQGTATLSLQYTSNNQIRQTEQNNQLAGRYGYDHHNRRVYKQTGDGEERWYHYQPDQQLQAELNSQGQITRGYLWLNHQLVGMLDFDTTRYQAYAVITDHLGTPRQLRDHNNQTVWQWQGEAFGATAPNQDPDNNGLAVEFNLRFPGQYHDRETGLFYNYFRYYDPSTGRYMQSDPIGLDGGLNTYAYAYNNPLYYIDPLGQMGLFPGPESCQYYEDRCKDSCGDDTYACNAKKCCESFGDNFFSNCTRKCLIDWDKGRCAGLTGKARDDCRKKAHYWCYTACINLPDGIGTGIGLFPPAECVGAAEAIGDMW